MKLGASSRDLKTPGFGWLSWLMGQAAVPKTLCFGLLEEEMASFVTAVQVAALATACVLASICLISPFANPNDSRFRGESSASAMG